MKAQSAKILQDIEYDPDLVVGRKYDGFSEIFVVKDGVAKLFNRSGKEHTLNVPTLTERKLAIYDFEIQCEGIGPSPGIASVKSILGSKPERAIQYQKDHGTLKLVSHNILSYRGQDLSKVTYQEKLQLLTSVIEGLRGLGLIDVLYERLVRVGKYSFFQEVLAAGGEGVVVKKLSGFDRDFFKVKRQKTWDVVIIGFNPANPGKFGGLIGAIRYGAFDDNGNLVEVGKTSGMSDEQRTAFSVAQESYIGKVVELEGQELGPHGRIRFPRFVRLRDDKSPLECTLELMKETT